MTTRRSSGSPASAHTRSCRTRFRVWNRTARRACVTSAIAVTATFPSSSSRSNRTGRVSCGVFDAAEAVMLTIIGCGNLNRSDDGVGVVVARKLMDVAERSGRGDVRVFDAGTGGMDVMFRARGSDALVLVDASRSGSEPGAVFRVPGTELARDYEPAYSLHDFRWDHALYA